MRRLRDLSRTRISPLPRSQAWQLRHPTQKPAVGALRNARFSCVGGRIRCTFFDYQSIAHNVTGFGGFITTTYECTNGSYAIPCPSLWCQPLPLQRDDHADGAVNTWNCYEVLHPSWGGQELGRTPGGGRLAIDWCGGVSDLILDPTCQISHTPPYGCPRFASIFLALAPTAAIDPGLSATSCKDFRGKWNLLYHVYRCMVDEMGPDSANEAHLRHEAWRQSTIVHIHLLLPAVRSEQ
jgi:hypothetical protein